MGEPELPRRGDAQPNLALRDHMKQAGLSEQKLASRIGTDTRTIQRWLDGETTPQSRNARTAASALACEPQDIWPDIFPVLDPPSAGTVALSVYASRTQVPVRVWHEHFAGATAQIDVCVYGGTFLFDAVPGFLRLVTEAAARGVAIRFLVGDPDAAIVARRGEEEAIGDNLPARCRLTLARLAVLDGIDGIAVRTHHTTLYVSLFRADDTLIANHHIYGSPASDNPVFVIEREADPALWGTYQASFEQIWSGARPPPA